MNSVTNGELPVISICIITYNHELCIKDAIESALAQKTEYSYEVIICDDCSSDRTVEVCRGFPSSPQKLLRILESDVRLGITKNAIRMLKAARGRYIAFCDGDDFWTDPLKLHKQVSYMEANPSCSLTCSDFDYLDEKGALIVSTWKKEWYGKRFDLFDEITNSIATTLTVILRRTSLDPLLEKITLENHPFIIDAVLWPFCLQDSWGYFWPEKTAVRRVLSTGSYSTKDKLTKLSFETKSLASLQNLLKGDAIQNFLSQRVYANNINVSNRMIAEKMSGQAKALLFKNLILWRGGRNAKYNLKYLYRLMKAFAAGS